MSGQTATHQSPPATSFESVRSSPTAIAREIDVAGAACLPSVISPRWLATAREYAERIATDRHEVMLEGIDQHGPAFVSDLVDAAAVQDVLEAVAAEAYPLGDAADRRLDCAIRVVNGPDPADRPLWFHYDATVVTMVIPVVIPDAGPGQSGELVLYPNKRPHRRLVAVNVVEKLVAQSNVYRRYFARHAGGRHRPEMIALQPGNAYLFWGYRSYHATMPCPTGATRVTVIIHYRDVHRGSRLLNGAKTFYQRVHRG